MSLGEIVTEIFSQSEIICFNEDALEQAHRTESGRMTRTMNVSQISEKVRTRLVLTEVDYVEPKTFYEAEQVVALDQRHRKMNDNANALNTTILGT